MTAATESRWSTLSRGGSAIALGVALAFSTSAYAQSAPQEAAADETPSEIIVTGSRISTAGFEAPTPTTVIGVAELQQAGRTDIAASLADLPQFRQTQSATSTNTVTSSGQSPADLRGLGSARTLVLINGRRSVSSNDLQTIPYSMVKQIDIVTGGASAAYGSGAVAGVVNIILDDNKKGFEIGAQAGISERGDAQKYLFEASAGVDFADGRGHFIIGGDYLKDKGIIPGNARPLIGSTGFFPDATGKLVPTGNLRELTRSEGGLIRTGVLAGQTFNTDGSLRPFQFGIIRAGSASSMIGGEGYNIDQYRSLSAPIERGNVFARLSFDVTDTLKVWAEGNYNQVFDERVFFPDLGVTQIGFSTSNPFLTAAQRATFAAAGETSFTLGRVLTDVSLARYNYKRVTKQGSIGFDGSFGGGKWRYGAFFTHGEQEQDQKLLGLTKKAEFANAIDAVLNPAGQIVCRVALTNPGTACRPLNLFGSGRADPAAVAYATGVWNAVTTTFLDNAGASISGEPFTLWDLPVSVAAGIEYREEAFQTLYDPNSLANNFNTINGVNIPKTGNNVKEAFAEVDIPLLANLPMVKKLSFNGAVRVSDYSTSGAIWSWKLGGLWEVVDGFKIRATRSRDIRAPSLTELFSQRSTLFTSVADSGRPNSPITNVTLFTGGNPNLAPEIANTLTVGAVFSPTFLPGFDFSIDYFNIKIDDVITTLSAQQIVNGCYGQNNQGACSQLVRDGGGLLTTINAAFINVANFKNTGVDIEASYRTRLDGIGLDGQLKVRALANYVDKLVVDNGVLAIDGAGYLGNQATYLVPKWRGTLTLNYESEGMGADLRTRYVDGGGFAPTTVLANQNARISSHTYVDLGLRAYIRTSDTQRFTVFGSVQNLFDRDPTLGAVGSPYLDLIGRYYTFGVRANF
jgi:iron complex outermembrane receptor protein